MARPLTVAATLAGAERLQPANTASNNSNAAKVRFMMACDIPILARGFRLQTSIEEIEHSGVHLACSHATDTVSLLRIDLQLELLSRLLQRVDHLKRILKEHVVVFKVVRDHQLAL